jgi:hypothetical protein
VDETEAGCIGSELAAFVVKLGKDSCGSLDLLAMLEE